MNLLREFRAPFADIPSGMIGFEDWESLPIHVRNKKGMTEKFRARHFSGIQKALGHNKWDSAYWSPRAGRPVNGFTVARSDMAPLLRMQDSRPFRAGALRPLRGAPFQANGGA